MGKSGLFSRLVQRLSRTQSMIVDKLRAVIGMSDEMSDDLLDEIESVLLQADIGAKAAHKIVERIRDTPPPADAGEDFDREGWILGMVRESIRETLVAHNREPVLDRAPTIYLFVGVNGTGKTTTVGKMILELNEKGKRVMVIAADTFRAAATEQLENWAKRVKAILVKREQGADASAVCYEGLEYCKTAKRPPDVVLIDTAGRLHTKSNLMQELGKIERTIKKLFPDAPHETILVVDATTGQNALNQVETFGAVVPLSGLIMTKLDGTAKGGVLVAVKEAYDLPIFKIGIGEAPEDLRDFDPEEFAEALFSTES